MSARWAGRWAVVGCMVLAAFGVFVAPAGALPDHRGYEMVSPPEKNGGNVMPDAERTRAAADGDAVGFGSLSAFGDAVGTGIATEYVSVRSQPGLGNVGNGWSTHAITPPQTGNSYQATLAFNESYYLGEFTPDLQAGVFRAASPVTDDPNTAGVMNLYLRTDLRTGGAGSYQELTRCPRCDATSTPLVPPSDGASANETRPVLGWMSPDAGHVLFAASARLTTDAPVFPNQVEAYEWDYGTVRLAGRIPSGSAIACDDVNGPACAAATYSLPAAGSFGEIIRSPHAVSDGSDGHTRVFFLRPTLSDGVTLDTRVTASAGRLYMRVDGVATALLNASERTDCADHDPCNHTPEPDATAPAKYLDASVDGRRVFFESTQALTNDAPTGSSKIYLYDTSKPASDDNLTLVSIDSEAADGLSGSADGAIGTSDDGRYLYFLASGALVSGAPLNAKSIYLWHDGELAYVSPEPPFTADELVSTDGNAHPQVQMTSDGRFLLYGTGSGDGLGGYDQSACSGSGCREFYLYSADSGGLPVCVSCNPNGAPATVSASIEDTTLHGGADLAAHRAHALVADGSKVFFNTAEALVPEDTNRRVDAYEYDVATRTVHLISSGTSTSDSLFMDASPDGSDVFFVTTQPLVGWDRDQAYDLYDARVDGGFPEPGEAPVCSGDACQGAASVSPLALSGASGTFVGAGNVAGHRAARARRCRRGFVRKRVRGRVRCVRRAKHARRGHRARRARYRAGRSG